MRSAVSRRSAPWSSLVATLVLLPAPMFTHAFRSLSSLSSLRPVATTSRLRTIVSSPMAQLARGRPATVAYSAGATAEGSEETPEGVASSDGSSEYEPKAEFLRTMMDRGFFHQCTDLEALDEQLCKGTPVHFRPPI